MNNEAQTQHFVILQKIKELGLVQGKTLTEIAKKLGTTRQNICSIKTKIEAHQDCLEGNFKSHYKKINLKKYKDYYVFSKTKPYVICYKKSDKFKELMGI